MSANCFKQYQINCTPKSWNYETLPTNWHTEILVQLSNGHRPPQKRKEVIPRPQAGPDDPVSSVLTAVLMHDWRAFFTPFRSDQDQLAG
jgi:hypothetical protein